MSSEFSCDYCSNNPRNPCYSKKEAATCPNAETGMYHDFNPSHVAQWIRYQASGNEDLLAAADLIEKEMY